MKLEDQAVIPVQCDRCKAVTTHGVEVASMTPEAYALAQAHRYEDLCVRCKGVVEKAAQTAGPKTRKSRAGAGE